MNNEIQNLINEKNVLNNTIRLRRERHNQEMERLRQEYFFYDNSRNIYRSNSVLNNEVEAQNRAFEEGLNQEFGQELQARNDKLNAERERLTELLASKTQEYNNLITRSFRIPAYMQAPMVFPEGLQKEIEEIQSDLKAINESLNTNGIELNGVKPQAKVEQRQQAPVQTEPVQAEPAQAEPVQTEPAQAEPVQPEPAQPEPVQPEPAQAEPVQTEPAQAEPVQPEPVQPEPAQAEPVQTEPAQAEPVQPEPVQHGKPKIVISKFLDVDVDGNMKNIGVADYSKMDEKLTSLLKQKSFYDDEISIIMETLNKYQGDKNVLIALLNASRSFDESTEYCLDYLSALMGANSELATFDLEYDLSQKGSFSKKEFKTIKKYALNSSKFAKINGIKMIKLRLASRKIGDKIRRLFRRKNKNTPLLTDENQKLEQPDNNWKKSIEVEKSKGKENEPQVEEEIELSSAEEPEQDGEER